jgi:GPH family glycoside/pentoside/hexuronide:cation symporter
VGSLLTFFDYQPDQVQSEFSLLGIALMLSVIPGFFHLLMGLLMYKYKITDNFYQDMVAGQIEPPKPEQASAAIQLVNAK